MATENRSHYNGSWPLNWQPSNYSNATVNTLPHWETITTVNLLIKVSAAILNFTILFLFYKNDEVRTAFNFYLVNLCMANFLHSTLLYSVELVGQLIPGFRPTLSFCVFRRYLNYITGGLLGNSHLLIALNRLLAVYSPASYRQNYRSGSTLSPLVACTVMWIYVHAWVLPRILIDAGRSRIPPGNFDCSLTVSGFRPWQLSIQLVLYSMPVVVTLLVYPCILSKMFANSRPRGPRIGQSGVVSERITKRRERGTNLDNSLRVSTHGAEVAGVTRRGRKAKRGGKLLTLSLMTLIATVLLLPAQSYYLLNSLGIKIPGMVQMGLIVRMLYSLTPVCDPLLFLLSVEKFRNAIRSCCRRQSRF